MSDEEKLNPISEAKLRANRENALKSTGPRTPEGKLKSSRNAVRHGILGSEKFLLAGSESRKEWLRFRRRIFAELQPVGELERFFADKVVWSMWRHRRLLHSEQQACKGAASSRDTNARLDLVLRYERGLENSIRKAMELLAACQRARARNSKTIRPDVLGSFREANLSASATDFAGPDAEVEGAQGNAGEGEPRT